MWTRHTVQHRSIKTYSCGRLLQDQPKTGIHKILCEVKWAWLSLDAWALFHLNQKPEKNLFKVWMAEESPLCNVTQHWVILRRHIGTIALFLSELCLCVWRSYYAISSWSIGNIFLYECVLILLVLLFRGERFFSWSIVGLLLLIYKKFTAIYGDIW